MRMYNCHVRLGNTTTSEVPKFGVSAAEIILLRHVHGAESVVKIEPKNRATASHSAMRADLRSKYELSEHKRGMVDSLFGPPHMPLPENLNADQEAAISEAVAAKEAEEDNRRAANDAEVDRRVKEEMAKLEAAQKNEDNIAKVNDPSNGVLTQKEIAEREKIRLAKFNLRFNKPSEEADGAQTAEA